MRAYEYILHKRQGGALTGEEVKSFIRGYVAGEIADYQMAAMCMAIFFRGMEEGELLAWTEAMLYSGETYDLSGLPGVKVDKHSTGGVGDKLSLALAPWVASLGVVVPMVSGRGLGHTGGTLDKLESIEGFCVGLSKQRFMEILGKHGLCMVGQSETLAPADKKLYALRDVTATVDCVPLIASSIMSKKLAEGADALVLDVKVGGGAFMKTEAQARTLAQTLIAIGEGMGKPTVALLSRMDAPLGRAIGNALEVEEALEMLQGRGPADAMALTRRLAVEMLLLAGRAPEVAAAEKLLEEALSSGRAWACFVDVVRAQGGNVKLLENPKLLPKARRRKLLHAPRAGYICRQEALALGQAAVALGAGRRRVEDTIDVAVGLVVLCKVGEWLEEGQPWLEIHYNEEGRLEEAMRHLAQALEVREEPPPPPALVVGRMDKTCLGLMG
ncbi:MAG: thymidine phosphorylase [Proteobacteria bacterium]|nr:thymidine phosphorylase [Cystobacterineae bacterium]MCL2313687.1 thymidine phosphorylase [Pseudomonadota bacterium]